MWILGLGTSTVHTSNGNGIESDSPRHAERREALDHADQGRFATTVGVPGTGISEEAGTASGRNYLTLDIRRFLISLV